VLGRYELGEELGEGGMATVFRARDRELRRDVAVKVLFPHLARRVEIVKRFHREARAAAGLEHPNILRIYDVGDIGGGEADDPPYIVMELIRGRTLLEEIEQRGPMLAEIVACVGALLADALAAAHAALIVHRDIKPSNVLVAQGGRLLLADFGVARLETESSLVTRTGALLGTPAYMSPEQASGDTATAKSDLYSLGATLYQLATGHLPYSGSPAKVMSQIAAGALVAPVRRRAGVGPDLSRLIEQMMASEPDARPASAAAIASDLRAFAAKGGFADAKEELAGYFADPDTFIAAKTPAIVTSLLNTAERAIAEDKLPRAMALADRASALAPNDPAVGALIEKVTEGGRVSRRRKLFAAGGIFLLVAGGATFGVMKLSSSTTSTSRDAASGIGGDGATEIADGATEIAIDGATESGIDGATEIASDGASDIVDARGARDARDVARDAREPRIDARASAPRDSLVAMSTSDGPRETTPDASPDAPIDAPPVIANGKIEVFNDTWCDVLIDKVPVGQIQQHGTFEARAGRHTVVCRQRGMKEWSREVTVTGGQLVRVEGKLLGDVEVTFELEAKVGNASFSKGNKRTFPPGRTLFVVDGRSVWLDLRVPCRLRSADGKVVCDP
jgi:serine/threonine-protein kinase